MGRALVAERPSMTVSPLAPEGANDGAALAPLHCHTPAPGVNTRRIAAGSLTSEALPASDTSPLDAARLYIAAGLAVVSCCALAPGDPPQCTAERAGYSAHKGHGTPDKRGKVRAGKQPLHTWEGRTSTSPDDARRWWAHEAPHGPSFALLIQGGLLAIDVDGPAGEVSLAAAVDVLGPLPPTLENVTGRTDGGRHLLFAVPVDASARDVAALTKSVAGMRLDGARFVTVKGDESSGLDLRAGDLDAPRSYIMVAPSVHASGARYQWKPGRVLAELPRRWWDALPRSNNPKPPTGAALPLDARPGVVPALAGERRAAKLPREESANDATERPSRVAPKPTPTGQRPSPDDRKRRWEGYFPAVKEGVLRDVRALQAGNRDVPFRDLSLRLACAALDAREAGVHVDLDALGRDLDAAMISNGFREDALQGKWERTLTKARKEAREAEPRTDRPREAEPRASTSQTSSPAEKPAGQRGEALDAGDDGSAVRPVVTMGTDQDRIVTECIAALASAPELYQRHPFGLQRIIAAPPGGVEDEGSPVPRDVPAVFLSTMILARCITFEGLDKKGEPRVISPPGWIAPAVLSVQSYPREIIRPLRGIIEAPALRPDGTVLAAPGYDPATELLLHWQGPAVEVPEHPTRDDARAAFEELAAVFEDATFAGERRTGLAACVAAVLTPLARAAIRGPVPAFMWEANGAGAGKTTLAQICGAVVMGRPPAVRTLTANDEENSKHIAGIAKAATPVVLFDNAKVGVEGGSLEATITAHDRIAPRTLGTNDTPELPWRTTIYVTANDASYSPDTHQRFVHVSLLAPTAARTYRHASPVLHAIEHRPALLRAALTILRAHVVAERPRASVGHERFVEWSRVVADAVAWSSGADPAHARPPESASRETEAARAVVIAWWLAIGGEEVSLAALRRRIEAVDPARPGASATPKKAEALVDLRAALAEMCGVADLARASSVALGKRLGRVIGRRYPLGGEGVAVALTARDDRNGVKLWRLDGRPIGEGRSPAEQGGGVRGMRGVAGDSPACSQNDSDEWRDTEEGAARAVGAIVGRVEGADPPHSPASPAPDNGRVTFDA